MPFPWYPGYCGQCTSVGTLSDQPPHIAAVSDSCNICVVLRSIKGTIIILRPAEYCVAQMSSCKPTHGLNTIPSPAACCCAPMVLHL